RLLPSAPVDGLLSQDAETFDFAEIDLSGENFLSAEEILKATYRVLKQHTFCIVWFSASGMALEPLFQQALKAGFSGTRAPAIWLRADILATDPNYLLGEAYEPFLVLHKGIPALGRPGRLNTFSFPLEPLEERLHPSQRPQALMEEILKTFTPERAKIMVPLAGPGMTLLAATCSKRYAVGFSTSETCQVAYRKLIDRAFPLG
ncbi:MAG: hypothetical protein RR609_09220, partial [Aurantimicrobium sp.]